MKYSLEERRIWLRGQILPLSEAKINVLAPTSQFGLNVFEGIPGYWNEDEKQLYCFRLEDHYKRLMNSAHLIQMNCNFEYKDLSSALIDVIRANEFYEDISIRQTLFIDGFGTWSSDEKVEMFVAPIPRGNTSAEYNKKGLNCCISSWRRITEDMMSPRIKCGANYINSRVGQREAIKNGYDTCIFLNKHGYVSESPGACLFIVKSGRLITPKLTDSVLESITRSSIIYIAKEIMGLEVEERTIDRTELYTCEEAFLCGSSMGITPIITIDRYIINDGVEGKITYDIRYEYLNIVKGNRKELKGWLTPIY